jgi:hypothetical protein
MTVCDDFRVCDHAVATAAPTVTGHRPGGTYFSIRHGMRYQALKSTTVWELSPDDRTLLQWENGNTTASDEPRGRDPEVCPDCDRLIDSAGRRFAMDYR